MVGRFLLHYSNPINWRLRNMEEHPIDPGWEVGSYSVCHPTIRPHVDVGTRILDVVAKDGKGVIRSAFRVNRVRGTGRSRVLYFDEYYFADREPIELPGPYIQYRSMKLETWRSKYGLTSLWEEISKQYTKYDKNQKPKSIDSRSWKSMVQKGSQCRKEYAKSKTGYSARRSKCK